MPINIIERAVTPYNSPTSKLLNKEQYSMFAPVGDINKPGMAGYNPRFFAVREQIVELSAAFLKTLLQHTETNATVEADGIKETNTVYSNFTHDVIDKRVSQGMPQKITVTGSLFVFKAPNGVTEVFFANGRLWSRFLQTEGDSVTNIGDFEPMFDEYVTSDEIADNAVTAQKLADDAVITSKLANDAVTPSKLANDAVTTEKVKDEAITEDKLHSPFVQRVTTLENKAFANIRYDVNTGTLTFTSLDNKETSVDLPLELIVTDGYYDEAIQDIVLVLANGNKISIPLDALNKALIDGKAAILAQQFLKNIVTTKNLLSGAEFVENKKINADGTTSDNNAYDHWIVTLQPGNYTVRAYSECYNLTTGETLTDGQEDEQTFELTEKSLVGVNSYNNSAKKLFSSEYSADEVEALNFYTIGENVHIPRLDDAEKQISESVRDIKVNSIKNIVTTKNLLTYAEYKAGHRYTINSFTNEIYEQAHSSYNYFKVKLPAGTYAFTSTAATIYNLTANSTIAGSNTDEPFTLENESVVVINSWGSSVKKLYSAEYTADEVEALGEYTLGENVQMPKIDPRLDDAEKQVSENADEIAVGSIKNVVTTKNLLQFAKFVKGYKLNVDGTAMVASTYDYYILTLPAGSYFLHKWSDCIDLTNGIKLVDGAVVATGTFTLEVETLIGVNSYKGAAEKLFSIKHLADEVEALGEYTIGENVAIPQIEKNSIQNIVTTKNLLTAEKIIEGYKIKADGILQASTTFAHYVLTLPAGIYTVCNYSECYNLTTGETLADGSTKEAEFTLTAESKVGINSYKGYTKKLFSSEYKADEVEDIGVYTSKCNVIPVYNDYDKYGLPVLKFTGDTTGMTKDDAVTLNYEYGERSGTCTLKWQGTSSLAYPKKNYTVKFDNKFEAADGWGEQKKYCLKANYIDFSHARNLVGAKLWGAMVQTRVGTPEQLLNTPNGGAVDGFPVCVVINDKYMGLYTFNIPKDGWMFSMGEGANEGIVCAEQPKENGGIVCKWESADVVLGRDYDVEYAPDENNVGWMQTSLRTLIQTCIDTDGTNLTVLEAVLDVNSAIDYYIFSLLTNNYDGITKNHLLATYDGTKWMFGAYDMDCLWGMYWNGSKFIKTNAINIYQHGAFKVVGLYYKDALKARYQELREDILSEENFATVLTNFVGTIPKALLDEEVKIWPGILNTNANNYSQMLEWYRRQVLKADAYINSL